MTVTLELPDSLAAQLQREADVQQESLEDYLRLLLAQNRPKPRNGKELVERLYEAGIIGLWKDREDIGDSLEFARHLRAQAETRNHSS